MYKKAEASFWTVEEVCFADDVVAVELPSNLSHLVICLSASQDRFILVRYLISS